MASQSAVWEVRPRYSYPTNSGAVFHASTAVAGVAPGTALSATPPFVLWNPLNSNKLASILKLRIGYVSGTLGAGAIAMAFCAQLTVPTGGAELLRVCGLLGSTQGAIRIFQGSTLSAVPTIIQPLASLSAALATTAGAPFAPFIDEIAGEIVIPPGTAFALQGIAAAGTTPLVLFGASYLEEAYTPTIGS